MRGIRLSDCLVIWGRRGGGKTTLAAYLAQRLQPVRTIVFDPKGELEFPGVVPCRTPAELAQRIRDAFVHYIPQSFQRAELEEACQIVWRAPGPYLWWVDEGAAISDKSYIPEGLKLAVQQGRQPKKMVMVCTQRLAEVHPIFRSQCDHLFMLVPVPVELDLKMIAGNVNREARELAKELTTLQSQHGDFSHLWYVRDTNELRRCAPLQPGVAPGPPPEAPDGPSQPGVASTAEKEEPQESAA